MAISVEALKQYQLTAEDKKQLKEKRKESQQRYRELSQKHTMTSKDRMRCYTL